jgi:hypothetical protein
VSVIPVPAQVYYSSVRAAGKPLPSSFSTVSSVHVKAIVTASRAAGRPTLIAASSVFTRPVVPASSAPPFPVKPVVPASSVVDVKPVFASSYKSVYGTAVPTGYATKTNSGAFVQYTGAAGKLSAGGVFAVGLVAAALAL